MKSVTNVRRVNPYQLVAPATLLVSLSFDNLKVKPSRRSNNL